MGGVFSSIGNFFKRIFGIFDTPPARAAPIDDRVIRKMEELQNAQAENARLAMQLQQQAALQVQENARVQQQLQQDRANVQNAQAENARLAMQLQQQAASQVQENARVQQQLQQDRANIQAQIDANARISKQQARQESELNAKSKEISTRDKASQFEQDKIQSELDKRYVNRDEEKRKWLRDLAKERLDLDYVNNVNVAINGQTGSGKSTLANAFRGLKPGDEGAANVDVNECTAEIKKYQHPTLSSLVIWDCPGAGTQNHPLKTYFYDKFLFAFDFLIFVFSERVREEEIDLMRQAIAHHVPFALVRNKANDDLRSKCRIDQKFASLTKEQQINVLIAEHKKFMQRQLQEAGIVTSHIFVINAWALMYKEEDKFEEEELLNLMRIIITKRRY